MDPADPIPGLLSRIDATRLRRDLFYLASDPLPHRTLRLLFCNEEHTPWTSVAAARNARARGDNLVAVPNLDGIGGRSKEDRVADRRPLYAATTAQEGATIVRAVERRNRAHRLGLEIRRAMRDAPGDDDGSFVREGYLAAAVLIASWPYSDPDYHLETDSPEKVDFDYLAQAARAALAAAVLLASDAA